MWQMIKENLETGKKRCCGTYTSFRQGLQYAPEVLDCNLYELEVETDEKDDIIGDFMQMGGKVAVVCEGYQFYLTRKIMNDYGKVLEEPSRCIRIGGKVKWKKGKNIRMAKVTEISSPDDVTIECLDGEKGVAVVPWDELKAE